MKRALRIALSLATSAAFLAIATRGVSWPEVGAALGAAHWWFLVPISVLSGFTIYLRALRWRILVRPLAPVSTASLFSATAIGFAANMLLPLRAGEVIRPWVLARRERLGLAPTIATVAVERLFDMAALLAFFAMAVLALPLPEEWKRYGWAFLFSFVILFGGLFFYQRFPERVLGQLAQLLRPLPPAPAQRILELARHFGDGLQSLGSAGSVLAAIGYSFAVWLVNSMAFGFGLNALGLEVPWLRGALTASTFVAIAVAVPGGPGFVGMFQLGCVVALGVYGVPKSMAFSYSLIVHIVQFSTVVILGIYFFLRENVGWGEISNAAEAGTEPAG